MIVLYIDPTSKQHYLIKEDDICSKRDTLWFDMKLSILVKFGLLKTDTDRYRCILNVDNKDYHKVLNNTFIINEINHIMIFKLDRHKLQDDMTEEDLSYFKTILKHSF